MTAYLALLRGINVGGNNMIKMAELKDCLVGSDLENVRTYIQSGNVLFESDITDQKTLESIIREAINKTFKLDIAVVVFSKAQWRSIIKQAPKTWGVDAAWKHNLLVMLRPYTAQQAATAIGELKEGLELVDIGKGVLYQSVLFEKFGRTRSGKLAANPIYKQMTIRNYNTSVKLLTLI